jgi:NAD(P)-dependent dehydrogenase (short-subunit alcohol dehydrogenase family)
LIVDAGAKHVEDSGSMVTIVTSLLAAFTGFYISYAGSKAPVEHFTRGVAKALAGGRISVNAIDPGPMDTREIYQGYLFVVAFNDLCGLLLPAGVARGGGVSQE